MLLNCDILLQSNVDAKAFVSDFDFDSDNDGDIRMKPRAPSKSPVAQNPDRPCRDPLCKEEKAFVETIGNAWFALIS